MDSKVDTAQRRAEALRVKLLRNMETRKGFSRGEIDLETVQEWNAEWDGVIKEALQQARRDALAEAVGVCNERAAFYEAEESKAGDDNQYRLTRGLQRNEANGCADALDRLREGVEG